mgnify:CR=1 FL=1
MSTTPTVLSDRFQLGGRIAAGGMACVFAGETTRDDDPLAGRPLAVKVLHDHLAENADFIRMFRDEGSIAARFEHTNVVRVYAVGEDGGHHYMVMDRVFGNNLAEVLLAFRKRRKRVPKAAAFEILRQMLSALVYVHGFKGNGGRRLGIVHRDISPHNILISVDEKVRLTDFGIARGNHRTDQTRTGTIKGKLHYMSPEQARGKRVDARADLYALGAVAWELFTERPLLQADRTEALQARVMSGEFDLQSPNFDALGDDLQAWLRKSLAVTKEERWQSAEAMQAALGNVKGASSSRFKPGILMRLLEVVDAPEEPEQPSLMSDAEMSPRRVGSSADVPSMVIRTPQRPISGVFVGPEAVSQVRRMSRSERMQAAAPRRSSASGRSRVSQRTPRVDQDASEAAVRHSAAIALQAAGADPEPTHDADAARATGPSRRPSRDAHERVSKMLVQQQRGLAVAATVAWSCVALLLFGTLLEVWNARLRLPRVDETTFTALISSAFTATASAETASASASATEAEEVSERAEEAATPPPKPRATRKIRNDRFLPRAAAKPKSQRASAAPQQGAADPKPAAKRPHPRRPRAGEKRGDKAPARGRDERAVKR